MPDNSATVCLRKIYSECNLNEIISVMNENFIGLSDFKLDGKLALVTGAGRGIGRACALTLAQAGARVISVARTQTDLDDLANESPSEQIETWCEDVTTEKFFDRIETLNKLDILVNNAGMNKPQPFIEVSDENLEQMVALNIVSMFRAARSSARVMLAAGNGGSIINMSSQMGHVGSPGRSVYCMTKHAIEGLTKAMAVELAAKQIRVNSVAPTFIDTPLVRPMLEDEKFREFVESSIPMGKVGQVKDVAAAVLFLASSAAALVTGDSLKVDGGWTAR